MAALFDCDTQTVVNSSELINNHRQHIRILRDYPGSIRGDTFDSSDTRCPTRYFEELNGAPYESFQWGFWATAGNRKTEGKTLHEGFKTSLGPRKFTSISANGHALRVLKEEVTTFLWLFHCHAKEYYAGKEYFNTFVDVQRLEKIVITTPSCFSEEANQMFKGCMLDAIRLAEFVDAGHKIFDGAEGRVDIMPEPEAALSTFLATMSNMSTPENHEQMDRGSVIALLDLGGGTSDAAIVTAICLNPQILCEDRIKLGTDHGGETLTEFWIKAADAALAQDGVLEHDTRQKIIMLDHDHQFKAAKPSLTFTEDHTFKGRYDKQCTIPM